MGSGQAAKNVLKRSIRRAARTVGPWVDGTPSATRILTYHSIGYRRYEMNVTPEAFGEQLAWLSGQYPVISLAEAAAGAPGVALTFDDGYEDNLTHAVPLLERYGFPATIFVVSGHLGGVLPFEREPETGRLLTAEGLREVARRGIEIGGHTRNHVRLSALERAAQTAEIAGCKADLEGILGRRVESFAYPYGSAWDYDGDSMALAEEAGFTLACSNRYGPVDVGDGPYGYRRIWIDSTDTLDSFADKVSGRLDILRLQDHAWGIAARRWLNWGLRTE